MDLTQILLSIFHGTNLFALRVSFWATALPDSAICSKIGFFYEPLGAFFWRWLLWNFAILLIWATFQNLAKTGLYWFKPNFLNIDVDIFDFDVCLLRLQNCFDVDLLGFKKNLAIWLKVLWQHCWAILQSYL